MADTVMRHVAKPSVTVLLLLVAFPIASEACSCLAAKPICQWYWEYPVVFLGTAAKIEPIKQEKTNWVQGYRVRFAIVEGFRGVQGSEVEIETGAGGGDCGYPFEQGERYLVFSYREQETGRLKTGICTPTRPDSYAQEDLQYIRSLSSAPSGGRIFGSVTRYQCQFDGPCLPFALRFENKATATFLGAPANKLPGVRVIVTREDTRYETTSDSTGHFELAEIPPGTYQVQPELPQYLTQPREEAQLFNGSCAEVNFNVRSDGRISGRILDSSSQPVHLAHVSIVQADERSAADDSREEWDLSDEDGSYEIGPLPPGRYVLGVNITEPPDAKHPFPRTFYPTAPERHHATVIELADGEKVTNLELVLLPQLEKRQIRVSVNWPDGRAAPGSYIYLHDPEYPEQEIVGHAVTKTDEKAQAPLIGFQGRKYWVHGYLSRGYGSQICADPVLVELGSEPVSVALFLTTESEYCSSHFSRNARQKQ